MFSSSCNYKLDLAGKLCGESPDPGLQHVRHSAKPLRVAGLSLPYLYQQLTGPCRRAGSRDRGTRRDSLGYRPDYRRRGGADHIGPRTSAGRRSVPQNAQTTKATLIVEYSPNRDHYPVISSTRRTV